MDEGIAFASGAIRLNAWREDLEQLLSCPRLDEHNRISESTAQRIVWFDLAEGSGRAKAIVEAIWLLNVLALVDAEGWRREVLLLCEHEKVTQWIEGERELAYMRPRSEASRPWRVGVSVVDEYWDTKDLTMAVRKPSASFEAMWKQLTSELNEEARAKADQLRVVPMRYVFGEDEGGLNLTVAIDDALKIIHKQRTSLSLGVPQLLMECVAFDGVQFCILRQRGLGGLHELAKLGVTVVNLPKVELARSNEDVIIPSIQSLLRAPATASTSSSSSTERGCLTSLVLSPSRTRYVTAITSALQDSPAAKTIILEIESDPFDEEPTGEMDDLTFVRHVAYSLFSHHATHSLETLDMSVVHCSTDAIVEIKKVINHRDPLQLLYSVPARDRHAHPKQIAACHFYLYNQSDEIPRSSRDRMFESCDPIVVRVIQGPTTANPTWWSVLLPGWGRAYVHQDDVIQLQPHEMIQERSTRPSFKNVIIDQISDESMRVALSLLEIVGTETKSVRVLEHEGEEQFERWCTKLFVVCPQLVELELTMAGIQDMGVFVDAAAAGHCKLETLALTVTPQQAADVVPFFTALCDPTHPLTKHLKSISLSLRLEATGEEWVLQPLRRVLCENSSLSSIQIWFDAGPNRTHVDDDFIETIFSGYLHEKRVVRSGAQARVPEHCLARAPCPVEYPPA